MFDDLNSGRIGKDQLKSVLEAFIEENMDVVTYRGKPLFIIVLRHNRPDKRYCLFLRIKWDVLLDYLEDKARNYIGRRYIMSLVLLYLISGLPRISF